MSKAKISANSNEFYNNFEKDKKDLIHQVETYLKSQNDVDISVEDLEKKLQENLAKGDITNSIETIEKLRDAKLGIKQFTIEEEGKQKILIRDASGIADISLDSSNRGEKESYMLQYLNLINAAQDIVDIELYLSIKKFDLETKLKEKANQFYHLINSSEVQTKEEQKQALEVGIEELSSFLEDNNIKDAFKKLNIAKDFQNFKHNHYNIATISSIRSESGQNVRVVEMEAGMRKMSKEQKIEFDNLDIRPWYSKLSKIEKELVTQYKKKITSDNYTLPTQLRQIPGAKNAFEKMTAVVETNNKGPVVNVIHSCKHSGTTASLSYDKKYQLELTKQNARQLQGYLNKDSTLLLNTLNSMPIVGVFGIKQDKSITSELQKLNKQVEGVKWINTAFNGVRRFGSSSKTNDIKNILNDITELAIRNSQLIIDDQDKKKINNIMKPKGFFGRLMRNSKKEKEFINDIIGLDENVKSILNSAIEIRNLSEKANSFQLSTKKNNSLELTTKLSELLNKAKENNSGAPLYEQIIQCASGKNRTGLSMHDQSVQAIKKYAENKQIKFEINELDKQLLKAQHTAQQGGSALAGGEIGCHGTKKENMAGIPNDRNQLYDIIHETASRNKLGNKGIIKTKNGIKLYEELKKQKKFIDIEKEEEKTNESIIVSQKSRSQIQNNINNHPSQGLKNVPTKNKNSHSRKR